MQDVIIQNLQKLIDVNTPIIYINADDYIRIDEIIYAVSGEEEDDDGVIEEWNPGLGLVNFYTKRKASTKYIDVEEFLETRYSILESLEQSTYLVIKEPERYFDNPRVLSFLQMMAQRKLYDKRYNTTIILVSSKDITIPQEIEKYVSYLDIPFPTSDEINQIIDRHIEINGYKDKFRNEDRLKLMPTLKGMTALQIDRMLDMAMSNNGSLSGEDKEMILQQKKQMIKNSGLLELIDTPESIADIGGMKALKTYLHRKNSVMSNLQEAIRHGVTVPKGIMLVGMPGCGKSLCAKASAALFQMPLLRLDMGSLMGKYVGQSESNLRRAIKLAEAAAPCVLWIDEIEKAFSGVNSGNESYTTRMFGYLLSWLQDKTSSVYVMATANNANSLPPELKRKGRFDEIFCVNLPNEAECQEIFKVHLSKGVRKNLYGSIKIDNTLTHYVQSKGFNGADIASVVDEAIEELFISKKEINDLPKILMKIAMRTICIKESCKKQIAQMNDLFKENSFIDATTGEKSSMN